MLVHAVQLTVANVFSTLAVNLDNEPQFLSEATTMERGQVEGLPILPRRVFREPVVREDILVGESDLNGVLNNFRDCIAMNFEELSRVRDIDFNIVGKPNSVPVNCKLYRASNAERESIRRIVAQWRDNSILRDTNSSYANRVLLVKKKNGEERLIIDYRKVNSQTVRVPFPLPDIDEHLMEIKDCDLFITLYTPACFAKIMSKYVGPLRKHAILYYLDDIFIPGKCWSDLRPKLILVLESLRKAGLTLKLSKCQFLFKTVTYLGFVISSRGIQPGEQKALAI